MIFKWQRAMLIISLFCLTSQASAERIVAVETAEALTPLEVFPAADPDSLVEQGKELFVSGDTQGAQTLFESAVNIDSNHEEANFYLGATRIVNVYEGNPEAFALLLAFGFRGPDNLPADPEDVSIFNFIAHIPRRVGADGIDFPSDSPNLEDLKAYAVNQLKPELDPALSNFAKVSESFVSLIDAPGFPFFKTQVESDQSDALLARSGLYALKAALYFLEAYNVKGDFDDLYIKTQDWTIEPRRDLLNMDPQAFTVADPHALARGGRALVKSINFYLNGSDAIRAEEDLQDNDLVHFDPTDLEAVQFERQFRNMLIELRASLNLRYANIFPAGEIHLKDLFRLSRFLRTTIDFRALEQTGGMVNFLSGLLGTEFRYALKSLSVLTSDYNQYILPEDFGIASPLEFDYTDVLLARSGLKTFQAETMLAKAYNHNLDAAELLVRSTESALDWEEVLNIEHPNVGILNRRGTHIRAVKKLLLSASNDYLAASDFLHAETDDQSDDALELNAEWALELEAKYREIVEILSHVQGFIPVETDTRDDLLFNFNAYFNRPFDLRPFFPQFNGAFYVPGTFPDPTFANVFPSLVNDDLTEFLGIPPNHGE